MITIGIDPGLYGAIAILNEDKFVEVYDMPVMHKGEGVVKNQVNAAGVANILRKFPSASVVIELVNAMPGQGVSSVFSLGDSFGSLRGVTAALGLPVTFVHPIKWKKYYTLTSDKEIARAKAINMYPNAELGLKKHSDRAEALLLAHYLWATL